VRGLELSEKYFEAHGLPMIRGKFSQYASRIAAGLVGDGSECFGYDDDISRDHDWGPSFCVWLKEDDFQIFGTELHQEISLLPGEFSGYGARRTSDWGSGRVGVLRISDFFRKFTGRDRPPETSLDWLSIPENALAACTNGKVFHDPSGDFSNRRNALLEFYPEDVRLKKIASRCMTIAQFGQYNFERCLKRKEYFAAQYAETKFCADVISLVFLLNRRYTPFFKWMHRALADLPVGGEWIQTNISRLVDTTVYEEKPSVIEEICRKIIQTLQDHGLSDSEDDFLLAHGPSIQSRIIDDQLREIDVWVG
jgi:hypothetical protein